MGPKGPVVLMVRHGRTAFNRLKKPRLRAWEDLPLAPMGVLDAKLAASIIKPYKPQMLYSSDFERDIATAHIMGGILDNLPQEVDYGLRTADMGELSGKTEEETQAMVDNWYKNPWVRLPSGESFNDFLARFYPAFDLKFNLAKVSEAFRPTIIVCHGRNVAAIHARSEGIPQWDALMPLPGGIMAVGCDDLGRMNCEFLTETEPILADV